MQAAKPDERVLIIAPVGQDGPAVAALLNDHGYAAELCDGPAEACRKWVDGAAMLLLTEEALELSRISGLLDQLRSQPPWSELPVVILTRGGESRFMTLLDTVASAAGSLTLLERPIGTTTLLRSVEVALRSRRRQYQVRDLLDTQASLAAELKEHAANLERLVDERTRDLRATNEQLESYVYSIAHDLRAPLRSMIGYSELLMKDHSSALEDNARNYLQRIQGSAEFMDKLLLDLLAFGRAARSEVPPEPVEIRKAWDAALFQCASQIEQIHAQVDTIEPLGTVLAHEATLGQCLANLLGNALKFTAPAVAPRIRFRAEPRGDRLRLWVEDNGIGIPADQQERVFRVFERLNGSRYAGTGIGLSIVRKGVERMGGNVGVVSSPGQGSRFWIELPRS